MCHETNHLFLFNYDLDEAVFVIEGLAEFSMCYAGYMSNASFMQGGMTLNVTMSAYQFSVHPSVSMFYFDENYYSYASYGISYMFWLYLSEKYGIQIIKDLISIDSLDGPEGIEYVLTSYGYNLSFNDLFLDMITALALDELDIYDNIYGFVSADFDFYANAKYSLPVSIHDVEYRYYSAVVKELLDVPNEFTIEIETPDPPRSLGVIVIILDESGWQVNQTILTGDGSTKKLFFSGQNIEKVLLVTSLIKEGTPNAPRIWMTSPIENLDFSFFEGFVIQSSETAFSSLCIFFLPVMLSIKVVRRKKFKISNAN